LPNGTWQPIPGQTNLPGTGDTVIQTNSTATPFFGFRARAWLEP
jgi:hypothetical protein